MRDDIFRQILEDVAADLQKYDERAVSDIILPDVDATSLDLGQAEIWKRLQYFFEMGFCHGEPDERLDAHCEACRDLYRQSIVSGQKLIMGYLEGNLSEPEKILSITYAKNDKTHSVSIGIRLVSGMPTLLTAKVEPAISLQKQFKASSQTYKSLTDIKLPSNIGDYNLEPSRSEYILFKQELPN